MLNEQFIKNCDAPVAILWTRFGTPTDKYGSRTEEEIEIMLKDKKQVEISFSFEKGVLLELGDFPSLDTSSQEHLIENCSLETLFGIPHAIQYKLYS